MIYIYVVALILSLILLFYVYQKCTCGICRTSVHLVGKVVIVTGANAGIGYETAKDFAERGARVILACRDDNRGTTARDQIIRDTGNNDVIYRQVDFASLASVRRFAENILKSEKRIDILVNNAGAVGLDQVKTEDGLLQLMQVNHFGPFLLTCILLPLLKSSAPSRIVNVSSGAHYQGKLNLSDLNNNKRSSIQLYSDTKLCNVLMATELSHRLEGTDVTINCCHPGVVDTDILKNMKTRWLKALLKCTLIMCKDSWEGAQTSIYLAVSPEVRGVSGRYYADCHEKKPAATALDAQLARKLWDQSAALVKLSTD